MKESARIVLVLYAAAVVEKPACGVLVALGVCLALTNVSWLATSTA